MSSGNFGRWQLAPPDSQQQRAPDWLSQHTYGYSQHTCPNKWTQGNLCEHTRQGSQPQTYPLVPTQPKRDSRSESQQMHRGIQRKAARSVLPKDQHASLTWPSAHYCGSRHSKVTTIHRSTSQEEQWHNEELHHFLEGLNRKNIASMHRHRCKKEWNIKPQPPWQTKMLITTVSRQYQCYRRNFTDTCTHKTEARGLPTRLARPQLHVRSTQQPASQQPSSGANEGNTRTPDAARRTRSRSPTTKATQIDTQSIQHEADAMSTEATAAAAPASTTTSHSTPNNQETQMRRSSNNGPSKIYKAQEAA